MRAPCHIEGMAKKRLERSRDPVQLAKLVGDIATGQNDDGEDDGKDESVVEFARRGGLKGRKARATPLTSKQRSEIARKADIAKREKQRRR